jgi:DNA-directed RNA polymerase specialized sigma24 family protein
VIESHCDVALAALLDLIAAGAEEPFRQLYDRTAPGVYSIAAAVVRDVDRAERITHQVYLDVWRRAGEFDASAGPVESWLILLTRARLIAELRQRRAEHRKLPDAGPEPALAMAKWQQRNPSCELGGPVEVSAA